MVSRQRMGVYVRRAAQLRIYLEQLLWKILPRILRRPAPIAMPLLNECLKSL
jgi:hypothetical protein